MNDNGLHGLELRLRISGDSVQAIPSGRHQSRAKTCEGPFVTGRTSSAINMFYLYDLSRKINDPYI